MNKTLNKLNGYWLRESFSRSGKPEIFKFPSLMNIKIDEKMIIESHCFQDVNLAKFTEEIKIIYNSENTIEAYSYCKELDDNTTLTISISSIDHGVIDIINKDGDDEWGDILYNRYKKVNLDCEIEKYLKKHKTKNYFWKNLLTEKLFRTIRST